MEENEMRSVNKEGFLSEQVNQWIEKHRKENYEWFKLCEDINRFSHSTMLNITIHNKYLPEIIGASLYIRAMSNFQGAVIMAERGMINEGKALLRCLLECQFAIVALGKDKKIVDQFLLEDQLQRRDYLEAYLRNKKAGITHAMDAPSLEKINHLLQDINKQIKDKNIKKMTKRDLAKKAGLLTTYDSAYKVLSGTIHVNARDLEQYLDLNDEGEIKSFKWGPDVKEIDTILFTAAESMFFILVGIAHIFSLSFGATWERLQEKYKSLAKNLG